MLWMQVAESRQVYTKENMMTKINNLHHNMKLTREDETKNSQILKV